MELHSEADCSCSEGCCDSPPPLQGELQQHVTRQLHTRETHGFRSRDFARRCEFWRFSHFKLQHEQDTHDPEVAELKLSFLRKRAKIAEIVAHGDMVVTLAQTGVCAAFSNGKRLAFLNVAPDEVVRSIFLNRVNSSLITVSVFRSDNFSSLKCRSTSLEYIRRGQPEAGFPLFETESLKWPGFVEFDDVNCKLLTYSAQDKVYCVWDMKNYEELYRIPDDDIAEVKISPAMMLIVQTRLPGHVPIRIVSIEDGRELVRLNHLLNRTRKVQFVELFNEKLLVKQELECLQIVDVRTSSIIHVPNTEDVTPSAFIFLFENQLFLTFKDRTVSVCNFRGEVVTRFNDHRLFYPDSGTNNVFVTSAQDYIIAYCKATDDVDADANRGTGAIAANGFSASAISGGGAPLLPAGTINVSNIMTGKCVARIGRGIGGIRDVTALYFNEERNELYVGTKAGILLKFAQ